MLRVKVGVIATGGSVGGKLSPREIIDLATWLHSGERIAYVETDAGDSGDGEQATEAGDA